MMLVEYIEKNTVFSQWYAHCWSVAHSLPQASCEFHIIDHLLCSASGGGGGGATKRPSHVLYMGISYSMPMPWDVKLHPKFRLKVDGEVGGYLKAG